MNNRGISRIIFTLMIALIALLSGCGDTKKVTAQIQNVKFGVLPVLQALPLFVAFENGYFKENGLDVELIMFNTAAEKDIALASGAIDGYFGDLFTPIVIEANGHNIAIIAKNYDTKQDRRMFGLVTKPNSDYKSFDDFENVPVAISSNSVIEFVTESFLLKNGFAEDEIEYVEVKNIGLRMQMLLSGQLEAATLPEPLLSAASAVGGTILADDSEMSTGQTVLIFRDDFIQGANESIPKFIIAVDKAGDLINSNPDSIRTIMIDNIRMPESLKDKYPVPRFPKLELPDSAFVMKAVEWLGAKNVLPQIPTYDDLVYKP